MDPPEKEPTKLYTREEITNIVSNFYATPSDYLIRTYFKIFRVFDGALCDKYDRRFNNVIFNNFVEINRHLTVSIFAPRAMGVAQTDLARVKYVSCIFPVFESPCAVFVQFFNPEKGIEHRVLGYTITASSLASILAREGVIDKVVGYCGDYCFRDPANRKTPSSHVATVRILSRRKVMDLPYCDRFNHMLFDLLLDYLPEDPSKSLVKLGETVMGMSGNSHCLRELVGRYKEWLDNGGHILGCSYATYVIQNFDTINKYLEPCEYLPYSIGSLFSSVFQRFFLVFMTELYFEIDKIPLTDNSAVVYYFLLKRIRDLFRTFEENNYIPGDAYKYYNTEINKLVDHKQLDLVADAGKVQNLSKELMTNINFTHSRALKFLQALLEQFDYLESHSWVLLSDLPLKGFDIHKSYHVLHEGPCSNCEELLEEVKIVNSVVCRMPLVEIDSVVSRWVVVLKECQVPKITELLEYLLSLPATCNVIDEELSGCDYATSEQSVRINLAGVKSEDVVEKIEEFFEDYWDDIEEIVEKNQIQLLLE